jgi:hypothetical protein
VLLCSSSLRTYYGSWLRLRPRIREPCLSSTSYQIASIARSLSCLCRRKPFFVRCRSLVRPSRLSTTSYKTRVFCRLESLRGDSDLTTYSTPTSSRVELGVCAYLGNCSAPTLQIYCSYISYSCIIAVTFSYRSSPRRIYRRQRGKAIYAARSDWQSRISLSSYLGNLCSWSFQHECTAYHP